MKILLGRAEYLKAVDKDFEIRFNIENNNNFYQFSGINKTIDELKQFSLERNSMYDYLLYGKLETLSDPFLNNRYDLTQEDYTLSTGYIDKIIPIESDMYDILAVDANYITLPDDVAQVDDVVLIYSAGNFIINRVLEKVNLAEGKINLKLDTMTGITTAHKFVASVSTYKRYFKEIASTDYIRVYNSGYSINIFGDQIYQFNTYKNINIENLKDNFNNPITELYIRTIPKFTYSQYFGRDLSTKLNDDLLIDMVTYDLNQLTYDVVAQVSKIGRAHV